MEIKTSKEIATRVIALTNVGCKHLGGQSKIDFTKSINNQKWVRASQILEELNHIRDVIRDCSFEDDFGEQCFKYCDLNIFFKVFESKLNKPEVTQCDLSHNDKKEDGIPPTNKLVGILPKRL